MAMNKKNQGPKNPKKKKDMPEDMPKGKGKGASNMPPTKKKKSK